jgi:uncharacterized protein YkwD
MLPAVVITPTETPTATDAPPTPTDTPTSEPTPTVPPSPTPVPQPLWLAYVNTFRWMVDLPQVGENIEWSEGARLHSVYMVNTNRATHYPDPASEWYTDAGNLAADFGNLAATVWPEASYIWAINYWMSAPFHGLPILDPQLQDVGFGSYLSPSPGNPTDISLINFGATLDIERGLDQSAGQDTEFPIFFPPDGGETWVRRHGLFEYPDPLASCAGYTRPAGAPIMIQTGLGGGTPNVTSFLLTEDGNQIPACMFHEGTYTNPDPVAQASGRGILNVRDAIVILPQKPLKVGSVYAVSVSIDSVPYGASFTVVAPPYE